MDSRTTKEGDNPHGTPVGQTKSGGLTEYMQKIDLGKGYTNTVKYTIIAASGSGKTALAFDLVYFWIEPFKNIIYINSHFDDRSELAFKELCKDSGIDFFEVDASGDDIQIPTVKNAVWIIDDTYTSSKRNQAIEVLIKKLWNKGRWNGDHVIYIAHLDKYLPPEALHNATAIFVDRAYEKFPVTERIPEDLTGKYWFKVEHPLDPRYGAIQKMVIGKPTSRREIIDRLKRKYKKIPKENKRGPGLDLINSIGKSGNTEASNYYLQESSGAHAQQKKEMMGKGISTVSSSSYGAAGTEDAGHVLDESKFFY